MKTGSLIVKPSVLTEARTLTDSDSGRTFFLNAAGGFTVTLPEPRPGINFEFIVKTKPTGNDYIISAKDADKIIIGQTLTSNVKVAVDTPYEKAGSSYVRFLVPDAAVGDSVELVSDGTYWYATAFSAVYLGVTIAEQSKSTSASPSVSTSGSPSASTSESPSASSSISPSGS